MPDEHKPDGYGARDLILESIQELARFQALFEILNLDVNRSQEGTLAEDGTRDGDRLSPKQYCRRQSIRATFSAIEGIVFSLKSLSITSLVPLTEAEIAFCQDTQVEISDKGELVKRRATIPFIKNLKYAFLIFIKSHQIDLTVDYSQTGFQKLQEAIKIRDRLMHPKAEKDLFVPLEDLKTVVDAYKWFFEAISAIIIPGLENKAAVFKGGAF